MVAHTLNPSTQETKAGDLYELEDNQGYVEKPYLKLHSPYPTHTKKQTNTNPSSTFWYAQI